MAEYIERKSLLEKAQNERIRLGYDIVSVRDIESMPASDVAPVQHGWWIMPLLMEDGHIHAECSHCHKIRIIDDYCSACGAIMNLEDMED